MSNEQWIIYLYGVWPDGGWSALLTLLFSLYAFYAGIVASHYADHISDWREWKGSKEEYMKNALYAKTVKPYFIKALVSFVILITLANFVPNKNTFLALVATPSLVESLESETGKLHKLNKLMDLGIDKAMEKLEEK